MKISGVDGSLCWGYHQAASLHAWTITRDDDGRLLTATVVSQDAFRVSQRPLAFVATHQRGRWMWPVKELQIQDGALTARLGPQKA